ncbi:TetR/AcrR family transcriptional regulator [Nocardiopsis aegyptia]|uniref:TetR/AcrR family transcriptional regulator n=1 Tax=Nocardiopsis aegyptia TaxID=220378 RepID=UPI00366C05EF
MSTDHSDPRRILELLWGRAARPSRGPRQALTVERIVSAAAAIADADGLEALSMRRLAAGLGVGVASLYTYVPGKDELLALMLDHAISQDVLPHTLPGTWREKVTAWARRDWNEYTAHPWTIQLVATRQLAGPGALGWLESALRVFDGTGLGRGEAATAVQSVDAFVRGQAQAAVSEAATRRPDGPEGASWRGVEDDFLARHVDFGAYPALVEAFSHGPLPGPEATFEFGLRALLDGIGARLPPDGRMGA